MRYEYKHTINYFEYLILKHRLNKLFPHDTNANAQGEYLVRSLYFDDSFDTALLEKINGVSFREKFRLRCYNNNFSMIKLEKKSKIKSCYIKKSESLLIEEALKIINYDFDFDKNNKPLTQELCRKMKIKLLRPKTIVEYIREAFIFYPGNVRITIDRGIKTALSSTDFLKHDLVLLPTSNSYAILEVKFEKFIPSIVLNAIQIPGVRTEAISKYAVSRRFD